MLIRLYQIVKIEFLPPLSLKLNVFQIIIGDQSFILLFLAALFWQMRLLYFLSKLFTNINTWAMTLYAGFLLVKCQVVTDILGKVS